MLSIDEINELERKNEINVKQYNSLLKQYNEVLRLAKENADSHEFCLQELECKIEALSRENDKSKEEILNLRGKNIQLEQTLKTIKETTTNSLKTGILISSGWIEQKIDEVLKND